MCSAHISAISNHELRKMLISLSSQNVLIHSFLEFWEIKTEEQSTEIYKIFSVVQGKKEKILFAFQKFTEC